MKKLLVFFLISVLSAVFVGQENVMLGKVSKIDSVLASVNGDPITLLDVLLETSREENRQAAIYSGERLTGNISDLRKAAINELVVRKLVYTQFKRDPVEIPVQDIESMVDQMAMTIGDGTRESLERRLRESGMTMNEIREKAKERIAVYLMFIKNCDRMVQVTPKEIYMAYEEHPERWSKPARIHIQLLQLRREESGSEEILKKTLENLQSMLKDADDGTFVKIVRENTSGPNAENGGDMGWIERDKLRPEFAAVLEKAEKGQIIGPVETPEGVYFIRVKDIAAEEMTPFEDVSAEIEKQLKEEAVKARRKVYSDQLKQEAVIRYFF